MPIQQKFQMENTMNLCTQKSNRKKQSKLTAAETAIFAMLGAVMFCSKIIMEVLPNIHILGMLTMVYTLVYRKKALFPIYVYVLLNGVFSGFATWWIPYLYIWAVLAVVSMFLKDMKSPLAWALLSGVFGLLFGALCAPVDVFIGGFAYAGSKWVSGIPFDLLHCGGNFGMALIMFKPLRNLLEKLYSNMRR